MTQPVRLMCASDRGFFRYIPTMLNSVVSNTTAPLEVGVVHSGVEQRDLDRLKEAFPQIAFRFLDASALMPDGLKVKFSLSVMSYARVLMADLVDWDKFVYVDIDMILLRDIAELYAIDLGDHPAAAVFHGARLNAGMILFNGRVWREGGYGARVIDYALKHRPKEADQESMEHVLGPEFLRIDPRWNVLVDPVWGKTALKRPGHLQEAWLLHFITGYKPWNFGRFLLPGGYYRAWRRYYRPGSPGRDWRREARLLAWQIGVLARERLRR